VGWDPFRSFLESGGVFPSRLCRADHHDEPEPLERQRPLAAEIDHQVNVKAEVKTGLIMSRLDDLERGMHFLHTEQCTLLREANGTHAAADHVEG